ncbi:hypothetical protein GCM10010300_76840 [Streptomyces olivaceoviridis]|uniref:hypothetical protein n=1 Tax=Streptomyces olivaceoviridis TaxID=1921 RepID=UPI001674C3E8|nr:hypothetical protein [Streptomyces olivaceoviridis]GGZ21758.1 hypothetical protein GCM10010300_76840 [Streptomyces olivaceoviridis]
MRKFALAASAAAAFFAVSVVVAPSASATADGCGDLSNGQLCIKHPSTPGGTYTTEYFKHSGGDVQVQLGYQSKYDDTTQPKHFDSPWLTAKSGKTVKHGRYLTLDKGWCIRALMKTHDDDFVGKWYCL